jgi:uncharacterized membrane protein
VHKILHAVIVGLIGAGVVHAAAILLVPQFGGRDLWARLQAIAPDGAFTPIEGDTAKAGAIQPGDPFARVAVCRFSIAQTPVRITAQGSVPFWSVSVFDRGGNNRYSFNDRSANQNDVDLLVATPLQVIELRRTAPELMAATVLYEGDITEAFAVLRVLEPEPSWTDLAGRFLQSAKCDPFILESLEAAETDPADEAGTVPTQPSAQSAPADGG